jgi:hypothetical protein
MEPLEALLLASPRADPPKYLQLLLRHFSKLFQEWVLLAAPDDGLVERMLALVAAAVRLCVLQPPAMLSVLSWAGESDKSCQRLLQLQEFLDRTAASHRSAERTPAWAWAAVDPARVPAADAAASAQAGLHRGIETTAKEAKAIPVRRHLLRVLAGPVTHLSATADATARALASPSLALQALIQRQRLERAVGAMEGWLYDAGVVSDLRETMEAGLQAPAPAGNAMQP